MALAFSGGSWARWLVEATGAAPQIFGGLIVRATVNYSGQFMTVERADGVRQRIPSSTKRSVTIDLDMEPEAKGANFARLHNALTACDTVTLLCGLDGLPQLFVGYVASAVANVRPDAFIDCRVTLDGVFERQLTPDECACFESTVTDAVAAAKSAAAPKKLDLAPRATAQRAQSIDEIATITTSASGRRRAIDFGEE